MQGSWQWQLLHEESYWLVGWLFLSFFYSSLSCFSFLFALFALPHFVATITMLKEICKASSPFLVLFGEFLKVQASSLVQSSSQNSSLSQLDSQFWFKGRDWEFFLFTTSSKISTQASLFKREKH
jgi:hypothetical protein